MIQLSRPHRPRRSGDWTPAKSVTFVVTLAATQSVTLAAKAAGMSRKAAYALKSRDPAFSSAWKAALAANRAAPRQGNKVDEVEGHPFLPGQGNRTFRELEAGFREQFFATLTAKRAAPVARRAPLP